MKKRLVMMGRQKVLSSMTARAHSHLHRNRNFNSVPDMARG